MNNLTITLYALSTCSHCKAVKALLDRHDITADVVEVDRLEGDARKTVLKTVKTVNSRVSFPTLVVGQEVVVGHKPDRIQSILEKNNLLKAGTQADDR